MCDDEVSVEQFCRRYVEPMGEESDHVHIVALTNALLVSRCDVMSLAFRINALTMSNTTCSSHPQASA